MNYGVLILAAGFSERMGQLKFLLKFNSKKTFIENIVEQYDIKIISKIVIIVNNEGSLYIPEQISVNKKVKIVINNYPEKGRFYSISKGLKEFIKREKVFIHNSDNPFANYEVLNKIILNSENNTYCVPLHKNKGGHPILLSVEIIKSILNEKNININFKEFLKKFRAIRIEVSEENILTNINTKDEYYTQYEEWKKKNTK